MYGLTIVTLLRTKHTSGVTFCPKLVRGL